MISNQLFVQSLGTVTLYQGKERKDKSNLMNHKTQAAFLVLLLEGEIPLQLFGPLDTWQETAPFCKQGISLLPKVSKLGYAFVSSLKTSLFAMLQHQINESKSRTEVSVSAWTEPFV